ncbi:MAG: CtpF protein [Proteobacteria bacterium]|nr:CtpF protein [Pseudomonadota bacterium]
MTDDIDERTDRDASLVAPLPRISIQVFTETQDVAHLVQNACQDRRMAKAHVKIQTGGAGAAVEAYREAPTPNVIIIETRLNSVTLLGLLDELAGYCDAGTRVIIIGHVNDVLLYRELLRRGVSDYLIAPLSLLGFIRSISDLFNPESGAKLGRIISVIGTKGGVGSSTIAHNLGYTIATDLDAETVIVDLDLAFGTAGLDFNQDPASGVVEAAADPERLDGNLLDRLLSPCGERLSLLAAPATTDRTFDFGFQQYEQIMDLLRQTVPNIVIDLPHVWTDWSRKVLLASDEIVIVTEPDLANLRNAKNMMDSLSVLRKNDSKPHLVINKVGIAKRPEIAVGEFAKAMDMQPIAVLPYDAQLFGAASNNGQMLIDVQAKHKATEAIPDIMRAVTGRVADPSRAKRAGLGVLQPLLEKLRKRA